jgi:hypothetical protein
MIWRKRILRFGVISIASAALFLAVRISSRAAVQQPPAVAAAQTPGTPGSPAATTTINGEQLPPPPQKFDGVINRNAAQSQPSWPPRDRDYQTPFRFTGRLHKLTLSIDRPKLTPEEERKLNETQATARDQR